MEFMAMLRTPSISYYYTYGFLFQTQQFMAGPSLTYPMSAGSGKLVAIFGGVRGTL
jgi:hypothetical protein